MKKHKNKIITGFIIVAVLAFAFWYGGDSPGMHGRTAQPVSGVGEKTAEISNEEESENIAEENRLQNIAHMSGEKEISEVQTENENSGTEETVNEEKNETDTAKTQPPMSVENAVISDKEQTCILSVRCDTILENIDWLNKEKVDIVPKDGIIFAEKAVTFYEGESVFNLLLREMKRHKIHMEFKNIPLYNSAYIEGIANLYEFDCGELSGWMYKVNGWFPNYGCSRYRLKAGDRVEFVYTCNLGADVGGNYAARNGI